MIRVVSAKLATAALLFTMFIELWSAQDCNRSAVIRQCERSTRLEPFFINCVNRQDNWY